MRTAILWSGEVRFFDHPLVLEGWSRFISPLKADLYCSVWDHRGGSRQEFAWDSPKLAMPDLEETIRANYKNIQALEIENQDQWFDSLSESQRELLPSRLKGTSSAPLFYKIHRTNQLLEDSQVVYDLVIRVRPDALFIQNFDPHPVDEDTIYDLNFGAIGIPERIYDIFFYGNQKSMSKMQSLWNYYFDLLSVNNLPSNLGKYDACRLLYLHSINMGLISKATTKRYTDVYRGQDLDAYTEGLRQWGGV